MEPGSVIGLLILIVLVILLILVTLQCVTLFKLLAYVLIIASGVVLCL